MSELTFEETLHALESLVETLAAEDVNLKDALAAYEQSQLLIADAQQSLAEVEQKVMQLNQTATSFDLEAFDAED
jgi:exodeoxyribonuclease VII small subunit